MTTIKLKKGYDLKLKGNVEDLTIAKAPQTQLYAVVPDDFTGVVPRLEKKEGDIVAAGEALYHDKSHEAIKVCSPVSGTVVEINEALEDEPGLINKDAFANWIIKVELSDPSQLDNLMDAKAYEEFCANE